MQPSDMKIYHLPFSVLAASSLTLDKQSYHEVVRKLLFYGM